MVMKVIATAIPWQEGEAGGLIGDPGQHTTYAALR